VTPVLVVGAFLLVALFGLVVIGLLGLNLWRRTVALGREVGSVGERLEAAQRELEVVNRDAQARNLERDLAALRAKYPDVDLAVRRGSAEG
jgi:uncharacterized protein YdbL (DUF1318 family)